MRSSISTRLIFSFLAIIFIMTGLFLVLSNRVISSRFNELLARSGQSYARRVAPFLERYYEKVGNWDNLGEDILAIQKIRENPKILDDNPKIANNLPGLVFAARDERVILLDGDKVILDTNPEGPSFGITDNLRQFGTPIMYNGEEVGFVIVGSSVGFLSSNQERFLRDVNRTLILSAIIGILAVLIVGVIQSQSIVNPIQKLNEATRKIIKGDYSNRVQINRKDELGEMAVSFNEMAMQLEQQRELRHRSMADIAHELRTPLSVLQIDLESMEDGLMEFTPENIRVLQNEVTHLRNLVEDLRILSRVDAGELSIEHNRIELGAIIREVLERQQSSARDKNVHLEGDLLEGEVFINGDAQRISQVLINLISNAVRHTPADGTVRVWMRQQKDHAVVAVMDTGEGIPAEDLPFLFDRLYRVEKSRTRDLGGSGLGLSIAKSLIQAHQGEIWAESQEGQGSTFKFKLPLNA